MRIDVGSKQVTVTDIVGGSRTVKTEDGVLALSLDTDVQYVEGAAAEKFLTRKARQILPENDLVRAARGKTVNLNVRLLNLGTAASSSEFVAEAPAGWMRGSTRKMVRLAPSQPKGQSLTLNVPPDARWGLHRMTLKLCQAGKIVSRAPVRFHLPAPAAAPGKDRSRGGHYDG